MKHISLFSGQGGFDLAAELAGWENVAHCERDTFCLRILKYYWPNANTHTDITTTDFNVYRWRVDIVTGGFPCQPFSSAGKQLGTADERHLWPEMLRVIREIKPPFVVGENVTGIINWNGGMVFEQVQADLEFEGYEVQTFVLPAAGIEAPHARHRVFFVAYSHSNDAWRRRYEETGCAPRYVQIKPKKRERIRSIIERIGSKGSVTDTISNGVDKSSKKQQPKFIEQDGDNERATPYADNIGWGCKPQFYGRIKTGPRNKSTRSIKTTSSNSIGKGLQGKSSSGQSTVKPTVKEQPGRFFTGNFTAGNGWSYFPTQSPIYSGNDGIPGRLDGITFSSWRNKSITASGNAVVPQLALRIFRAIEEFKKLT